jgi:hypothetical protein
MFYAPYKRGDRVLVEYQVDRVTVTRGLYLIIDVCPDKRGGFHYEAAELTKKGHHARPSRTALAVPSPHIDDAAQ